MAERLEIIISATNQASGVFRTLEREALNAFGGIGTGLQNMGNQIAGIGQTMTIATAPLAAGLGFGIKTFSGFENVLAEIQARTGATAQEMENVQAKALDMGAKTAFSATQAADAMLQLLSSGYDLEQTFTSLPSVLNAAAAGGLDLGYTADVVTDALAMFNLEAEDASRVADVLAQGAGASSAEINDLAQGLGNVGPLAAQFGLSIEDTVAILAAFSERGIKGAEAGTQLKSMLTSMSADTAKVTDTWDALGISLFDTMGNVRPLNNVMNELRVSMADMTEQERIETIKNLAGSYGQLGLSVLTSSDVMGDMSNLMLSQADAAVVAEARMNTLSGRFDSMMGSVETLMITALEPLIENTLKPLIETVTEVINQVSAWAAANPELTEQITQFLAVLVAAGPTLFMVGQAISLIGGAIALLFSPIGLAIAAVVALYVAYRENWLGIGDAVDKFVKWFTTTGAPAIRDYIVNTLIPTLRDLYDRVKKGWEDVEPYLELFRKWFVDDALPAIHDFIDNTVVPSLRAWQEVLKETWTLVEPYLAQLYDWFTQSALPGIANFLTGTIIPLIGDFINILSDLWRIVQPFLAALFDWFVTSYLPQIAQRVAQEIERFRALINIISDVWRVAYPYLQQFFNAATNGFNTLRTQVLIPIWNMFVQIANSVQNLINKIGNIDLGVLNQVGGLIGRIPGLATGGAFAGLARVGETGEELVYAPGGAVVIPPELTQAIQSLTGNNYNLTINTSGPTTNIQNDFRMMEALASG